MTGPENCGEKAREVSRVWSEGPCVPEEFAVLPVVQIASNFILFHFIYLFIYLFNFWLCWVFVAACGLSLVVASGGYSRCSAWASHCSGFSLLQNTGSRHTGFSSCGERALERWLSSCGARA